MLFDRVKPLDAILATAEKKGLHRTLGAFQLTMLGVGAVIGTGIFVLTSEAAQKAGAACRIAARAIADRRLDRRGCGPQVLRRGSIAVRP